MGKIQSPDSLTKISRPAAANPPGKGEDMRSYSYCRMIVDGNETASLDIYREHNTFSIYEHDENVFSGGYTGTMAYIEAWKKKWHNVKEYLEAGGHVTAWKQTIR